jgi:CheY-like chemotaxis protein
LAEANAALQAARDQALEASNLKSAFVANISHELRTPLSGILGLNEILISNENLRGDDLVLARMIQESAQALLQVVNDILDLSKIEAGKITLEYSRFNLRNLLADCTSLMAPGARNRGLTCELEIDPQVPDTVFGDASRLRQVLLNLIGNAIKFTEKGGVKVRVDALQLDAESVKLGFYVKDTGIGISAEDQKYLFKPFSQVDNSSTRRFGGTGLGLAISRQFVEMMGGTIKLESEKGKGSTFGMFISFDRVRLHDAQEFGTERIAKPAVEPIPVHLSKDRRVLIVEDNPVLQQLALRQMSTLGVQADTTPLGREAIHLAMSGRYDLVFMDINLPDLSGLEATGAIRNLELSAERSPIPIIAMTAGAMKGDQERSLAAGMNDYLSKPVPIDALKRTLEKWLPAVQREQHGPEGEAA